MAKLLVASAVVEELLFGFSDNPVEVRGALGLDADGCVVFEVSGPDIPDVLEVRAICTVTTNRAGQRLVKMSFEAT